MYFQLIFWGLALLLRGEGVLLRRRDASGGMRLAGWLLCMFAWWMLMVGLGAYARLWPIFPAAIIGALWQQRWRDEAREFAVFVAVDLIVVIATGLLALPPLGWMRLLGTAVLLSAVGVAIELIARAVSQRINWTWLAGLGVAALLAVAAIPPTRDAMNRILQSRFFYLLPETMANTASPLPQPTNEASTPVATIPSIAIDETSGEARLASGKQWTPYEWEFANPSFTGNPFDVEASAAFTHTASGEAISTGLFYDGDEAWRLRFTGTLPGRWDFVTSSDDPELDGHKGAIQVAPNPGVAGFVTNYGSAWGRTGVDAAFVPQYVMIGGPHTYYQNPAELNDVTQTFFSEHGFNGVHTLVFCRWFDITQQKCSRVNVADPNPDVRTFEALEALITHVHAQGGVVHIWMWGDDMRSENQKRWGINGEADKRLQRYIAARLGPLPGWTMGYGYDLYEWVSGKQLAEWHAYMQAHMGWKHYLGARSRPQPAISQLTEALDYSAYEQLNPRYEEFVAAIEDRPEKPSFSEDRFRVQTVSPYPERNWSMEQVRRGLWHSTMAGGVANIWGNLSENRGANSGESASDPFPNPEQVKTYATFFENRFEADMARCNVLTNGYCLQDPANTRYIFYMEESDAVEMDLADMEGDRTAVAVDARSPYVEIPLGELSPDHHSWTAPYVSDWAIAVGSFRDTP